MVAVDNKLVRRRERRFARAITSGGWRGVPPGVNHGAPGRDSFCRNISQLPSRDANLVTTQTWGVTQRYVYSPYGSLIVLNADLSTPPVGTQPISDYLYQGMTLDAVTGLYYARNRNYSPSLGVWISQDPAVYINGANTYQMEMSEPVGGVDPGGLDYATSMLLGANNLSPGAAAGTVPTATQTATLAGGAGLATLQFVHGKTIVKMKGEWFVISGSNPDPLFRGKPTSVLYIAKMDNPKKIYRLDYGKIPARFGQPGELWHHNQEGVTKVLQLGVTDHSFGPGATKLGRAITLYKWGGRALFAAGVAGSLISIYEAQDKARAVVQQVGGWAGAWIGAEGGAYGGAAGGAAVGVWVDGIGAAPGATGGAIIGGLIGGATGFWSGERIATTLYDWAFSKLQEETWYVVKPCGSQ